MRVAEHRIGTEGWTRVAPHQQTRIGTEGWTLVAPHQQIFSHDPIDCGLIV